MDEIQAAFLSVKLPHLEHWNHARRAAAARYDQRLDEAGIRRPAPAAGEHHVYHVYAVRMAERDRVRALLAPHIATSIHYPTPVHLQPAFADLGGRPGDFPVAEAFCAETLSLPMHPGLGDDQVDRVCEALAAAQSGAAAGKAA
jgi:dTDP-4-amino-4,6-dideoxygalactose transaminase